MKTKIPLNLVNQREPLEKRSTVLGTGTGLYGWSTNRMRAFCPRYYYLKRMLLRDTGGEAEHLFRKSFFDVGAIAHAHAQDWHQKEKAMDISFYRNEGDEDPIIFEPDTVLEVDQVVRQYRDAIPTDFFGKVVGIEKYVEFNGFLSSSEQSKYPRTTAADMLCVLTSKEIQRIEAAYRHLEDELEPGMYAVDWKFIGQMKETTPETYQFDLQFPYTLHGLRAMGLPVQGLLFFLVTKAKKQKRHLGLVTLEDLEINAKAVDVILKASDLVQATYDEPKFRMQKELFEVNPAHCLAYGYVCEMARLGLCDRH